MNGRPRTTLVSYLVPGRAFWPQEADAVTSTVECNSGLPREENEGPSGCDSRAEGEGMRCCAMIFFVVELPARQVRGIVARVE